MALAFAFIIACGNHAQISIMKRTTHFAMSPPSSQTSRSQRIDKLQECGGVVMKEMQTRCAKIISKVTKKKNERKDKETNLKQKIKKCETQKTLKNHMQTLYMDTRST